MSDKNILRYCEECNKRLIPLRKKRIQTYTGIAYSDWSNRKMHVKCYLIKKEREIFLEKFKN